MVAATAWLFTHEVLVEDHGLGEGVVTGNRTHYIRGPRCWGDNDIFASESARGFACFGERVSWISLRVAGGVLD